MGTWFIASNDANRSKLVIKNEMHVKMKTILNFYVIFTSDFLVKELQFNQSSRPNQN